MRTLRTLWRRLTSMRTALILLFLLAVAAVPGSLLPQRPLNPSKVSSYIATHGWWGRFLNAIGMFDVFAAPWFAAIYLLLFISLVGCLVPRIRVHARAVVRKPLKAPRNLDRLPESGSFETAVPAAEYATAARQALGRRWRIVQRTEESGATTLSAEKGYSRETGNLIFHIALLVALILVAIGQLYKYEGQRVLKQGDGFCNEVYQYDSWIPGRLAADGKVRPAPFCIDKLNSFTADYTSSGEPSEFRADITYQDSVNSPEKRTAITVNHPLRLEGDRVYLITHGFAPRITVRMPNGAIMHDTQSFIPTNATTFFSEGAFKEQGSGTNDDIGISGFFAPSPTVGAGGTVGSTSPIVDNPVLGIFVYQGNLNGGSGQQSVYSLNTSGMKKIGAANLTIGKTVTLKDGVTVTFDGWIPWVSLQISHDPTQTYLLLAALAMVLGLVGSLGVRRRRLWLRIAPGSSHADESLTVVTVGGLARSDTGNFTSEFAGLMTTLRAAATDRAPRPDDDVPATERDPIGAGKD